MLSFIRVRNYAVIDEVEVEFGPGFSAMTGETGAGKSILVDALSLALGDRADAAAVRQGATQAEISVQFECPADHPALEWLAERDLSADHECLLRRVVSAEGRSRAFINGHVATLQDLRNLGSLLVDIHGQNAHHSLLQTAVQRQVLDAHGAHEKLVTDVAEAFKAWQQLKRELDARRQGKEALASELELLRFQADELEALALEPDETQQLEVERSKLANVDRLAAGLNEVLSRLYEADAESAQVLLGSARLQLERLTELDPQLGAPAALLSEAEIRLREAATDLGRYRDRLEIDPQRLEQVEARLVTIRALARRHRAEARALPALLVELRARIRELEGAGESLEILEGRSEQAAQHYFKRAKQLTAARENAAESLAAQVSSQLAELGLPHGRLRVEIEPKTRDNADATGLEQVRFEVSLNPGQAFGPLARVASGGELSRLSLALEVVSAGATRVPTLVFDEVDAGIGGGVAEIVGRRLSQIAKDRQVLCVTHLPQVASQGRCHYRVVKVTDGKSTHTEVRPLDSEQRVEELSRMLGGVEITERARAHAAEMIDRAAH
jgi:DNA repair protein RecN (Recombination protein N)